MCVCLCEEREEGIHVDLDTVKGGGRGQWVWLACSIRLYSSLQTYHIYVNVCHCTASFYVAAMPLVGGPQECRECRSSLIGYADMCVTMLVVSCVCTPGLHTHSRWAWELSLRTLVVRVTYGQTYSIERTGSM